MSRIERKRRKRSVRVDRVYDGDVYVRVNSVGSSGDRSFILIPGIGVSSTYFERLAPHLNGSAASRTRRRRSRSASTPISSAGSSTSST
jgi:hypothetical protein